MNFGWSTFPHPPYSSHLTPIDYHLFRSLSNYSGDRKFNAENDVKMDLANFFAQRSQHLYERRILPLAGRWQQVIDSNETYIVQS